MYQYLLEENLILKKQLTYYQEGTDKSINSPNKTKHYKNNTKRTQEIFYTE
jgi:hypothetical protein